MNAVHRCEYLAAGRLTTVAITLAIMVAIMPALTCNGQELIASDGETQPLVVRLFLAKRTFSRGESIPVTIQASNSGKDSILVGNYIADYSGDTPVSRVVFQLRDAQGHALPAAFQMIADSFSARREANAATAFLRSYLLLRPGYSLATRVVLAGNSYKGWKKPGKYRLSATYASNGLSYPPTYQQAGLTADDVKSIPFKAWNGKLATNEVSFEILAGPAQ